ncbi:MAG: bifunctional adenosylcobinamide kinase/adenosylcobinamide-phosphate guanylyltransferase [Pseudomonadota bacterium]
MKQLFIGGVRSGKSALAEAAASASREKVIYVATAQARDAGMAERIERHRAHRPANWTTREEPLALPAILREHNNSGDCVLIECVGLWVNNLLEAERDNTDNVIDELLTCVENHRGNLILVSPEVGLGIMPMNALARRYADTLGELNQALAQRCDRVTLAAAGLPLNLKG